MDSFYLSTLTVVMFYHFGGESECRYLVLSIHDNTAGKFILGLRFMCIRAKVMSL